MNAALPEAGLRYLSELEAAEARRKNAENWWFSIRGVVLAHPNTPVELAEDLRELGVVAHPWYFTNFAKQRADVEATRTGFELFARRIRHTLEKLTTLLRAPRRPGS